MNNDNAYKIRQTTLQQHKREVNQDNINNILSLILIITITASLAIISTIYYCNWYILQN